MNTRFSTTAETGRLAMDEQKRKRQQDDELWAQEKEHSLLSRKEAREAREEEAKQRRQEREDNRKDDANHRKDDIRMLELHIELKHGGRGGILSCKTDILRNCKCTCCCRREQVLPKCVPSFLPPWVAVLAAGGWGPA